MWLWIILALVALAAVVIALIEKKSVPDPVVDPATDPATEPSGGDWTQHTDVPWEGVAGSPLAARALSGPIVTVSWDKPLVLLRVGDYATATVYLNGKLAPVATTCQWAMDKVGIVQMQQSTTVPGLNRLLALKVGAMRLIALSGGGYSAIINVTVGSVVPPLFNEPAEFKTVHEWDGRSQGAWLTADGTPIKQTFVHDAELNDTVMAQKYGPWVVPAGHTYGPGHLYFPIPAAARPLTSFYVRAQLKLSANWKQPTGPDQKLFQAFGNSAGGYNVGTILWGVDGAQRLTAYENNSTDPRYNGIPLGQNPPGSKHVAPPPDVFTLDKWHTIEFVVMGSAPGQPNGKVIVWLDNKKQIEVDDMMWTAAGQKCAFFQFDLNALWGGQGGSLAAAQYMYVGKIRLSGI